MEDIKEKKKRNEEAPQTHKGYFSKKTSMIYRAYFLDNCMK